MSVCSPSQGRLFVGGPSLDTQDGVGGPAWRMGVGWGEGQEAAGGGPLPHPHGPCSSWEL